ncbi:MAG: helix-turn-helix domain-containing protein [Nocardioidaceae bacterium]
MDKLLYRPEEAARSLGIGRTRLYALIASGDIASVTIGNSRRISSDALRDFIRRLESPSSGTSSS